MVKKEALIVSPVGLKDRHTAFFVQQANKFESEIRLEYKGGSVDAKSLTGVLALDVPHNAKVKIIANGPDEKVAAETLADFVGPKYWEKIYEREFPAVGNPVGNKPVATKPVANKPISGRIQ